MLTQQRLRELVDYNPETGDFRWRGNTSRYPAVSRKREGKIATVTNGHGHSYLYIDGEKFAAARLAWLYMTGQWPEHQIDHANQRRWDDRWENLRQATVAENCQNRTRQTSNTSGCRGVWKQNGKWLVRVTVRGQTHYLGSYDTFEEAVIVRNDGALRLHGEFAALDALHIQNPN